jgi:hypothetical protein
VPICTWPSGIFGKLLPDNLDKSILTCCVWEVPRAGDTVTEKASKTLDSLKLQYGRDLGHG